MALCEANNTLFVAVETRDALTGTTLGGNLFYYDATKGLVSVAQLQNDALVLSSITQKDPEQACLLLLGAARELLGQDKPTATLLAKWLRRSGSPVGRLDRALNPAVRRGEILASGAKRSRRYALTPAGYRKALLAAYQTIQSRENS